MEKTLFANLRAIIYSYRRRFFKAVSMVLFSNCLISLNPMVLRQEVTLHATSIITGMKSIIVVMAWSQS